MLSTYFSTLSCFQSPTGSWNSEFQRWDDINAPRNLSDLWILRLCRFFLISSLCYSCVPWLLLLFNQLSLFLSFSHFERRICCQFFRVFRWETMLQKCDEGQSTHLLINAIWCLTGMLVLFVWLLDFCCHVHAYWAKKMVWNSIDETQEEEIVIWHKVILYTEMIVVMQTSVINALKIIIRECMVFLLHD